MRLIDADAAADKIMRETEKRADDLNMIGIALMIGIARMLRDENDFPTVEAAPVRHGRWLPIEADGYADGAPVWDKWECSECGHEHDGEEDTLTDYCPDCGRKMYVDDDSGSGVGQTFSPD